MKLQVVGALLGQVCRRWILAHGDGPQTPRTAGIAHVIGRQTHIQNWRQSKSGNSRFSDFASVLGDLDDPFLRAAKLAE